MDTWKDFASRELDYNRKLEKIADQRIKELKKCENYYLKNKVSNGHKYFVLVKKKTSLKAKDEKTATKKTKGKITEKYIGKGDNPLVLEMQEYNICKKVKKISSHNVACIEKALSEYIDINDMSIRESLKPVYINNALIEKNLLKLNVATEWKKNGLRIRDEQDRYYPEKLVHKTDDGEMVRTRGEVIFANTLNALKVEYIYELPHEIGNQIKIPDFTILHPETGEEVLIEYMGM